MYLGCPQSYAYKYIDNLPDTSGQAAVNGTCVHSALEEFYQVEPQHRTLFLALNYLARAHANWPEGEAFTPELEKCQTLVHNLFDLEDPTTINCRRTEMDMLVPWYEDHQLRGIMDRVDVEEDGYVIVDYKTGKAPSDQYMSEKALGMKMYALMGLKAFGTPPVRVKLLFLGTPQTVVMTVTDQMLVGTEMRAVAAVDGMEKGGFKTNPGNACTFCVGKEVCPDVLTSRWGKRKVKP